MLGVVWEDICNEIKDQKRSEQFRVFFQYLTSHTKFTYAEVANMLSTKNLIHY